MLLSFLIIVFGSISRKANSKTHASNSINSESKNENHLELSRKAKSDEEDFSYYDETEIFFIVLLAEGTLDLFLLILIIIMACRYPNRLYRLEVYNPCCYCCCMDKFYIIEEYYGANDASYPCKKQCCVYFNGWYRVASCVIIFSLLTLLPLVLLYILISLCVTSNENERAWEIQVIRGKQRRNNSVVNTSIPRETNETELTSPLITNEQNPMTPIIPDEIEQSVYTDTELEYNPYAQ